MSSDAGAISPGRSADDANDEAGHEIATSVARLAKSDTEVDVQTLSRQLKLPELMPSNDRQSALTWEGPLSQSERHRFFAYYRPPHSSLGINAISLTWEPAVPNEGWILTTLRIGLNPGTCPSGALLAKAIGVEATTMQPPGVDGGPSIKLTFLNVEQPHGEPVVVTYAADDTCSLIVMRRRTSL
ncbi:MULTISPECIES: hypothetical protein [unclassified Dyella]|uniref:hypothetical protein n=1 Tax=unclassified Dyella TaxID=2634549 RepID=UPI0011AF0573|nr:MULTISPECIES: hypothetical protein [unclassified Dyella]MDR3443806.1 hypothetical protein [Dyella sp.]